MKYNDNIVGDFELPAESAMWLINAANCLTGQDIDVAIRGLDELTRLLQIKKLSVAVNDGGVDSIPLVNYKETIARGLVLLQLCERLESGKYDPCQPASPNERQVDFLRFLTETAQAQAYLSSRLEYFVVISNRLEQLGRELVKARKVSPSFDADLAGVALDYVLAEHGVDAQSCGTKMN